MKINEILLRKRTKVALTKPHRSDNATAYNKALTLTVNKNLETLGYILSNSVLNLLARTDVRTITAFNDEIVPILKEIRGANRVHSPMYPNFPKQVMEASDVELYTNAMIHYFTGAFADAGIMENAWLPEYNKDERPPLFENIKLSVICLADDGEIFDVLSKLASANGSVSATDASYIKEIITRFPKNSKDALPDSIPSKEMLAILYGAFSSVNEYDVLEKKVKSPTDVLRIATGLSGGDVSLAENTKFKSFSRPVRRSLLKMLEATMTAQNVAELPKHTGRWLRLGERIHPMEKKSRHDFPKTAEAFSALRNGERIQTTASNVEAALLTNDVDNAVFHLEGKPGDFARRLDKLLRMSTAQKQEEVLNRFLAVASGVSTPVLVQVFAHFKNRDENGERIVFAKGATGKARVIAPVQSGITETFSRKVENKVASVLMERFATLPALPPMKIKCDMSNILVPFSQRSSSRVMKTIVRGSKVPITALEGKDTVRFFIWWKGMLDIDLSAVWLDENFNDVGSISYRNLRQGDASHSGDITRAPNGAAEYIDVNLKSESDTGRYIVMCVNSYSMIPFCEMVECFAGYMMRERPQCGEIFDARTVENKFDITADSNFVIPFVIDTLTRNIIWMDLGMAKAPDFYPNNVSTHAESIRKIVKGIITTRKATIEDLMQLHIKSRKTDDTMSPVAVDLDFAMDVDTILSEYMK